MCYFKLRNLIKYIDEEGLIMFSWKVTNLWSANAANVNNVIRYVRL